MSTFVNWRVSLFIVASIIIFISSAFATPYNWTNSDHLFENDYNSSLRDYGTYRTEDMSGQWVVLADDEYSVSSKTYCVGIIGYYTLASGRPKNMYLNYIDGGTLGLVGEDPTSGIAFGYYATLKDGTELTDCDDILEGNIGQGSTNPNYESRPGIITLHGFGQKGEISQAIDAVEMISTTSVPVFALSISSPGQGYDCGLDYYYIDQKAPWASPIECQLFPYVQRSHGTTLIANENSHMFTEGFSGYTSMPVHPDRNNGWAYMMSAMRAVSLFDTELEDMGILDEHIIMGGFSFGGLTTLGVSAVDNDGATPPNLRLDGVYVLSASGGFDENMNVPSNWIVYNHATRHYETPAADESIDCDDVSSNPQNYTGDEFYKRKACEMMDYLDPILVDQKVPIYMVNGSQDEIFNYPGFEATIDHIENITSGPELKYYYLADWDHATYLYPLVELLEVFNYPNEDIQTGGEVYETYWNINGATRLGNSVGKFCQAIFDDDLDSLPDAPGQVTISLDDYTHNDKHIFEFEVSGASTDNIWFNISIDSFFHVLPACTDGDWTNHTYTIDLATTPANRYHNFDTCRNASLFKVPKCANWYDRDDGDILEGEYSNGTWKVTVVFDNSDIGDIPVEIAAWAENRLVVSSETKFVASGPVATWFDDPQDDYIEPCVRAPLSLGGVPGPSYIPVVTKPFKLPISILDGHADIACEEDFELDSNYTLTEDMELHIHDKNIIIPSDVTITATDYNFSIVSGCDVTINGTIAANDTESGSIYIFGRNIDLASSGTLQASGARGGGIYLYSKEDTDIQGEIDVSGTGSGSEGGVVNLIGSGSLIVEDTIDAKGVSEGGDITIEFRKNIDLEGALIQTKATGLWGDGGDIFISSGLKLIIDGSTEVRATGFIGGTNGSIDLQYCLKDIHQDADFYPANPGEEQYCHQELIGDGTGYTVITSNTTWDDGPYLIMEDVHVCNAVLTIDPGQEIYFAAGKSLYIGSAAGKCKETTSLVADAYNDDTILFSSIESMPEPGDWGGIALYDDSVNNILENVIIEYGGDPSKGTAVAVLEDSTDIDDIEIAYSGSVGIYFNGAEVDMVDSWVHDCEATGVKTNDVPTNSLLENVYIDNCAVGIDIFNDSDLEVDSCVITDNWELGIDISDSTCVIHDSEIIFNSELGTDVGGNATSAGIFIRYDALNNIEVTDANVILGNMPEQYSQPGGEYELINLSDYDVDAESNWWGTDETSEVADLVYDYYDNSNCGVVDYTPILTSAP